MLLASSVFEHNSFIPHRYTCDGEDINPPLIVSDVPANAKSLALLVDDPDAPAGDWVHWLVWNIDPSLKEIPEKSVPVGSVQGITDFGKSGWGGPCPPTGTHRYFFKLFALDQELDLSPNSRKAEFLKAIDGHVLSKSELIGLYKRS